MQLFQFAIENSYEAAFWIDSDAKFIYVNNAAVCSLGYSREELSRMTIHDIDPDFPKTGWKDLKNRGSFILESRHRTKDGIFFPVEISVNYLEFEGKEYCCAVARNITERQKKEKAIQLSKREWESTFDAILDWVSLIDLKSNILRSNRIGEIFVGVATEKIIGKTCCKLLHGTSESLPECPLKIMLQTHQRESVDIYSKEMDRWLRIAVDPVTNENGEIIQAVHIVRDITELKKVEEEHLRAMKLESIGIIAGGIAHDFNNLLSIIIGNIDLAKADFESEIDSLDNLKKAENALLQARELTKQLITFSTGGSPIKKAGSIGKFVKDTTTCFLSDSYFPNIRSTFHIPQDLWVVDFDEGQMKHAIDNIILNAMESMNNGGTIGITAENIKVDTQQGSVMPEGKYVKISIEDEGDGIPEEHLSRIFDPYFTTKAMGVQKGLGLGLATTYSIINRHNGHIEVDSKIGVGTRFIFYLPADEKDLIGSTPEKIQESGKYEIHTQKILLMDDEEMIRTLAEQIIRRIGYDAEFASDGVEAVELYRKAIDSQTPFEVVILDLTIKNGMGGKDAVKKILEINPQAKVIVSSGYSNDPVMTNHKEYGFLEALSKPYKVEDLKDLLEKVMKHEN